MLGDGTGGFGGNNRVFPGEGDFPGVNDEFVGSYRRLHGAFLRENGWGFRKEVWLVIASVAKGIYGFGENWGGCGFGGWSG